MHDIDLGFSAAYEDSRRPEWKRTASYPPMLYPTHSIGGVLGAIPTHAVGVNCIGVTDDRGDGVSTLLATTEMMDADDADDADDAARAQVAPDLRASFISGHAQVHDASRLPESCFGAPTGTIAATISSPTTS